MVPTESPPTALSTEAVRLQLDRILSGSGFVGNARISKFLRFVVEQQLLGKGAELKESLVGIEVFGRTPGFDPRQDSVVRTEAARLRARLSQYYAAEGAADTLIIELPKGGYVPVFLQRQAAHRAPPKPPSDTSRWGNRVRLTTTLAGVSLIVAVGVWWWVLHPTAQIPVAVLPLINLSEDSANDYFADGLTYEIIRNLSIIEGLEVRSPTSSFAFNGKPRNVREAGKQLNAEYILEGSVLRSGQHLRISALLVRVRDDVPLWSGKFDRELTDVFAIQDEISTGIVNSLRLKVGGGRRRYETSPEAYDHYLRGRALPIQRGLKGFNESIGPLERAIAIDPAFAPAYAGLAAAHASRSGQFQFDIPAEVAKMRTRAEKAVQLDPLLAEAHAALAIAYARDAQWTQSEISFRRAVELAPNRAETYGDFVMFFLWPLGRLEEALEQIRIAEKADPLSPRVQFQKANVLKSLGRFDEADRLFEKSPEGYAVGDVHAEKLLRQGRSDEVIRVLESVLSDGIPAGDARRATLGCAYARAGRREDAEKLAAASVLNPFIPAKIFVCLGDRDRAFAALDRAVAAGPFRMGRALNGDGLAMLRGDPRLVALRRKVGLPE